VDAHALLDHAANGHPRRKAVVGVLQQQLETLAQFRQLGGMS
jgi:hypothetical protein